MPGPNSDNTRAKIILELKANNGITVKAIADKIDVHVKTVKRHIDQLMAGSEPKVKNEKTKYYWIAKHSLREKELNSFLNKLMDSHLVNMDFATDLIGSIKRSKKAGKIKNEPFAKEKDIIRSAIDNNHQIKTVYESRDGGIKKTRFLSPVNLNLKSNKVECWDNGIFKTFNIEKMKGLRELKDTERIIPSEKISPVKKDVFGFRDNGNPIELYLNLTEHARSMLLNQFVHLTSLVTERGKKSKYRYRIHFKALFDIAPIARFVVGLLHEVEIDTESKAAKKLIAEYYRANILSNAANKLGIKM